jgi:iron complex transport system permease protein
MQTKKVSFGVYYAILTFLLLGTLILSIRVGAVPIPFSRIFLYIGHALGYHTGGGGGSGGSVEEQLFLQIRLPRVVLCAFVGASLSVSGALMQALFRNPIVEPGLVGTSSGAAFGAAFVFVMGRTLTGSWVDALVILIFSFFDFVCGFV